MTRVTGKNYASKAKVSTTDYGQPGGDIDVPSVSLIDGNYDTGYVSANVHSNEDLSNTPYYLTEEFSPSHDSKKKLNAGAIIEVTKILQKWILK